MTNNQEGVNDNSSKIFSNITFAQYLAHIMISHSPKLPFHVGNEIKVWVKEVPYIILDRV